ncbi:MAG: carbonic anhydrase [Nitrospirae bacterium]|nr:carbonic anhydrase [Nitrospirota bacterium]
MEKLVEGFKKFQAEIFGAKRELFTRLSEGQTPRALFITCSDSRIDPTLLTQAEPGELFILRNAGNIVPSYGETMGGSTATIEYAVAVLGVKHIVVCGHTDCGVMRALLHPESVEDLPAVKSWMIQAETTRRIVRENYADLKGEELLVTTIQENVRIQLDHLKTHPAVAVRLRRKTLTLHGWVYSIPTGDIWAYDDDKDVFVSLAEPAR